jgi:hypothetical protein
MSIQDVEAEAECLSPVQPLKLTTEITEEDFF